MVFFNGDMVKWITNGQPRFGRITDNPRAAIVQVAAYNIFFRLRTIHLFGWRLEKLTPAQISKLNNDINDIVMGRLQYNQHYYKTVNGAKPTWHKGFKRYQKLCKEYDVPLSPK